jgi:hypothetical protein
MAATRFTQADVTRAVKGAVAAGVAVQRVEIDRDGRVVLVFGADDDKSPNAALEAWERKHGAR